TLRGTPRSTPFPYTTLFRSEMGEVALVLGSHQGGKVYLVAMATEAAVARGARANEAVRRAAAVVGGGGGGNERMAQAGGKDPSRSEEHTSELQSRENLVCRL